MFGYVRICAPELKMAEYEQYRGVYCALCKTLGRRYGLLSRFTLSYDFTFLALFHMALDGACPGFAQQRCGFNPLRKRLCCGANDHLRFAADAAVLSLYYKLADTRADEGFFKRMGAWCLQKLMRGARRKAAAAEPALDAVLAACTREQAAAEALDPPSPDAAAEPTARMLEAMLTPAARDDKQRRVLERFGYCLGRWIYFADAADDREKDRQKGHFNPFNLTGADPLPVLNLSLAECAAAYRLLDIHCFAGILENVLRYGLPGIQKQWAATADAATNAAGTVDNTADTASAASTLENG